MRQTFWHVLFSFHLSMCAYGAMMALAGLIEGCALDSQSSSCAFNWDPENMTFKKENNWT